jgi:hypothetical protein
MYRVAVVIGLLLCTAYAHAQKYDFELCATEHYERDVAAKGQKPDPVFISNGGDLEYIYVALDESLAPSNCPKYYITVLQARLAQQAIQQPATTRNPLAYAPSSGPSPTIYVETPYVTAPQIQITPITAPAPTTPVYRETFDAMAHYNDVVRQSQAAQAERQMSTIIANQPEPRYGIRGYGTP